MSTPVVKPYPDRYFISVPDAARFVGVSIRTLYRLVAAGTLPAPTKLGGRSLIPHATLAEACKRIERGGM